VPSGGPRDGVVELVVTEVPELGLDEVLGEARQKIRQLGVGGQRNPSHRAVVVTHETDMAQQAADVLPAGESAGVQDDAWNSSCVASQESAVAARVSKLLGAAAR
jgi:hypothetical protein